MILASIWVDGEICDNSPVEESEINDPATVVEGTTFNIEEANESFPHTARFVAFKSVAFDSEDSS